ncbi:Glyoxalase/bleomycin resistance protein/dioxygenase [Xylariales sp. PMI_506]|nr:Glyoxalase/bleomycin resistance protein/dioxygenase [Xylariales sp. PMI_506]
MADTSSSTLANPLHRIAAISLFVEDLAASKAFYASVFEAPIVFEDHTSCAVKLDNLILNLLQASEGATLVAPASVGGRDAGRRFQMSIWVDDLDSVVGRLKEKGVELLTGPQKQPWGMYTATFTDPAGHSWEVGQNMGN